MNKLYSMLSLAKKAGALKFGEDNCEKAIKSGDAKLVFVAIDASNNTKKKFTNKCKFYGIDVYIILSKQEIEAKTGMVNRSVVAVIDDGLARVLAELCKTETRCINDQKAGS